MVRLLLFVLIFPLTLLGQSIKISDMPAATTPSGTELVPIVQGGVNKKATISQFTVYPSNGIPVSAGSSWGTSIADNSTLWNNAISKTGTTTLTGNTSIQGSGSGFNFKIGDVSEVGDFSLSASGTINLSRLNSQLSLATSTGALRNASRVFYVTPTSIEMDFEATKGLRFETAGTTLNIGSDANEDLYVRRGGYLTRIGVGSIGNVLTVNGSTQVAWAAPSWWALTGTSTLTGASTIVGSTTNTLSFSFPSLGVTRTNGAGHWLVNSTSASSGNQQISPNTVWEGQGWKTTATAASQSVRFMADVLPVQGTANPTGRWRLGASINGGAYSDLFALGSDNVIGLGGTTVNSWNSNSMVFEGGGASTFYGQSGDMWMTSNGYFDGSWRYKSTGTVSNIGVFGGEVYTRSAVSGTIGNVATFLMPFKSTIIGGVGTVGLGNNITTTSGSITGATAIINDVGLRLVASSYANFGTTSGTSGYGFRDNGGIMEWKNSGGAWAGFGAGGGGDMFLGTIQTVTARKDFNSGTFSLFNPANTFKYNFLGSAIVADITVTLPLLTGNDTFVMNDFAATLTNKTLALGSNTISGSLAEFNTALTGADFATGGGTATGTNTGDQTISVTGTTTATIDLSGDASDATITGAGISAVSVVGDAITITSTEVDGSISNEGSLTVAAGTGTTSIINSNTSGSTGVTLTAGTGLSIAEAGNVITLANTGIITEVDGSVSNELQTVTNSSAATTHTVTLSNSGGSVQLVEGANITLTTTGTAADGIVTIASTGGGGGITNGAAANELMKSDGTNAVASGLGSSALGDLNLGLTGTTGATRTIQATGSASDISTYVYSKGLGGVVISTPSGKESIGVGDNVIYNQIVSALTNTTKNAHSVKHYTTATAAVGFGVEQEFNIEDAGNNTVIAGKKVYRLTDATSTSGDTDEDTYLAVNGTSTLRQTLKGTGQLQLPSYTSSSSFTGTAVANLQVDASGNILTTAVGGGSGLTYAQVKAMKFK